VLGSAIALAASASSQAAIVQDQNTFVGTQQESKQYDFSLAPGTFQATLSDVGIFAPFSFLSLVISENGGSFLSFSSLTPTTLTFSIPDGEGGPYRATISGIPGVIAEHAPAAESTYTFSLTSVPGTPWPAASVPEPAVWLLMACGIGLLGFIRPRKTGGMG
jgi:hypothetical protein